MVEPMATDEGLLLANDVQNLDDIREVTAAFLVRLFVVGAAGVWILFWGLVARLQLQQGEFLPVAVVAGFFVIPAIIGLGYNLRSSFPIE